MAGTGLAVKQPADEVAGTGLAVKQPANEVAGTGLEVKQPADDPTGTGLAVNSQQMKLASLRPAVEVDGGSAVVLATQKAGSDLPNCLPPTYRLCLSPFIPTPLICKTQFSPTYFFVLIFVFTPSL